MNKQNLIKILIPIIAVVVVTESIILVSNLDKNVSNLSDVSSEAEKVTPTEEISQPVADFIFETETKEMKVGKSYEVNLSLVGKQNVNLDAMEVYIKYDSKKMTVSKLTVNKDLPKTTKNSGINAESGLISSVFLWDIGEIYSVKTDEVASILSFMVTPKVVGDFEISLLTGNTDEKSVTMIVENPTSKSLMFLGNKLEIQVSK
jgi:hypothetical protein